MNNVNISNSDGNNTSLNLRKIERRLSLLSIAKITKRRIIQIKARGVRYSLKNYCLSALALINQISTVARATLPDAAEQLF